MGTFNRKHKEDRPVVALCYDFDKTLTRTDMQAQGFIQSLGYEVKTFWDETNGLSAENDMDNNPVLGYHFNWVTIDDENGNPQECLLLNDRDIQYVFEGEERKDVIYNSGNGKLIIS